MKAVLGAARMHGAAVLTPRSHAEIGKFAAVWMSAMVPDTQRPVRAPVVVVVDDDQAVCNSLKFALELEGFRVRDYRSAAELLRAGDLQDCSCFVIDQRLPALSGLDLIATLRAMQVLAPAILVTSNPPAALHRRAQAAKIDIVEKPLLGNTLVERIREACA
jgi:two-component system, LuxR family, response regulator FixJ